MPLDFTKCDDCGKIFPATDPNETLCPACKGEVVETSDKDILRQLKNFLRDVQARGEFLNIPQLAEDSGVDEIKIWHYINTGELATASFDDPGVRDFLVRKKREQAKAAQTAKGDKSGGGRPGQANGKKPSGFYGSNKR